MKKGLLSMLAILCMTSLFTACSKDDGPTPPTVTSVEGVYKGQLTSITLGGVEVGKNIAQKVYITKISDSKVKMELKNFAFQTLELGTISVEECDVVVKGAQMTFTGSQTITLSGIGECDVDLKGVINGNSIVLDINVDTALGKVVVNFLGDKMAADQSSEAKITSFTLPADKVSSQPIIGANSIVLMEGIPDANLKNIVPTIVVSKGATITPKSGVAQDFTKPIVYTVVSEDGITTKKYTVTRTGKNDEFTFEEWTTIKSSTNGSTESFQLPVGQWGSTNPGVMMMNDMLGSTFGYVEYPVAPTSEAKQGQTAAIIKTLHTEFIKEGADLGPIVGIPYITAGSLFPSQFILNADDQLKSTLFGIPFFQKTPISFQGWYKYTPGTEYRDDKNMLVVDGKDKFAIYAVLYTELLVEGVNVPLDGHTIKNSDRIVFKAEVPYDGPKSEWAKFEVPFNPTGNYNPLNNHYLAIIATSSFEGDAFKGAKGSTLVIDDFKVISQ